MKLPQIDYHIHTAYCGHAEKEMTVANIIKRAEEIGLKSIAITDHVYVKEQLHRIDMIKSDLESIYPRLEEFTGNVLDDFGEIFALAKDKGINIELNEFSSNKLTPAQEQSYHQVIKLALEEELKVSLGSDAHSLE